jgi:hypothetical protein
LRTATWQPTATRDARLLRGYPARIRTENNAPVSDRSAVNVAPFQLSEKLRCIHSITHFSAIILSLPWRKQTRATIRRVKTLIPPAPPASVLGERRGLRNPWLHQYARAPAREGNWRLLAQRQRRINKRLAMVSPLAAGVAFQLVLVIAICEDRSPVKPLSRSPHLNTLSGSLSHRSPGPDNCSCYPLPIPCRCS